MSRILYYTFSSRIINFLAFRASTVSANLSYSELLFTTTVFHVFHAFWDWVLKGVTAAVSRWWSCNIFQMIVTLTCESFKSQDIFYYNKNI